MGGANSLIAVEYETKIDYIDDILDKPTLKHWKLSSDSNDDHMEQDIDMNLCKKKIKHKDPYDCYELIGKLGKGNFATVNIAESLFGGKVAIKEIHIDTTHKHHHNIMHREINILSQLNHENIVRLYDIYVHERNVYMVRGYRLCVCDISLT